MRIERARVGHELTRLGMGTIFLAYCLILNCTILSARLENEINSYIGTKMNALDNSLLNNFFSSHDCILSKKR